MKTRTRLSLVALALAALSALPADARTQGERPTFFPDGEGFSAWMPAAPTTAVTRSLRVGELKAEGRRYEAAGADGAAYVVLSLKDVKGVGERLLAEGYSSQLFRRESAYLDAIAELAWEVFVRAEAERHSKRGRAGEYPSMDYVREFKLSGAAAREYFVKLPKARGPVYVAAAGPRIYVVAALGPDAQSLTLRQFVDSFALKDGTVANSAGAETKAAPADAAGGGVGLGRGANTGGVGAGEGGTGAGEGGAVDYSRPFRPSEVTRRVQVIAKPEPLYTESARKFGVTGIVSVRAVLGASGEVEHVGIISGLPHGLTLMAVEAARKIKFSPALKDGRPVSQWVTIQYNFNIY